MAFCGVIGSKFRREYTLMGDAVNLSARLMGKGMCGVFGVRAYAGVQEGTRGCQRCQGVSDVPGGTTGYEGVFGVRGDVWGTRGCLGYEWVSGVRGYPEVLGDGDVLGTRGYGGYAGVREDIRGSGDVFATRGTPRPLLMGKCMWGIWSTSVFGTRTCPGYSGCLWYTDPPSRIPPLGSPLSDPPSRIPPLYPSLILPL